ncbi:class I SAM-dependent methyltransferase [Infirmifilum sp. NZ]|uniref:class I SAM-dependent methyltransferase n=1 Tax=Infirmifilum sp. NZ TaxID=2926850 RepID=UPI00279B54FB|nr:class I SAM-dependent methyltransferase family protein [Infirmifilum sp. NZ]UNQ72869.1 class I SAM-dependent methyltransferase family protein [Infirmifilum sp. NZ]
MPSLRELLKDLIPGDLLKLVPSSFDIVGSRAGAVAIVEIPEELEPYKRVIAEKIMELHKNVRAVYRKLGERTGEYRVRELELIGGESVREVLHKEHGYLLKLDVTQVYFSPREATERQRVASKVKPGEFVVVMFAGVGPFAIAIAKKQPLVDKVVAIEINPVAYKYMVENIRLNRLEGKVVPVLGDVREEAPKFAGKADRVVMPLPKGAYMYLREAFACFKREGGVLHFYYWDREDDLFKRGFEIVRKSAEEHGFKAELQEARVVSPYAPRVYKLAFDVLLSRRI